MSFQLLQVSTLVGGNMKIRCLGCGETEQVYPNNVQYEGSPTLSSTIMVAHICPLGVPR